MGSVLMLMEEVATSGIDSSAITTALTSGLTDAATNIIAIAAAVVPIGVGVFGVKLAITYAKKFFAKIAG